MGEGRNPRARKPGGAKARGTEGPKEIRIPKTERKEPSPRSAGWQPAVLQRGTPRGVRLLPRPPRQRGGSSVARTSSLPCRRLPAGQAGEQQRPPRKKESPADWKSALQQAEKPALPKRPPFSEFGIRISFGPRAFGPSAFPAPLLQGPVGVPPGRGPGLQGAGLARPRKSVAGTEGRGRPPGHARRVRSPRSAGWQPAVSQRGTLRGVRFLPPRDFPPKGTKRKGKPLAGWHPPPAGRLRRPAEAFLYLSAPQPPGGGGADDAPPVPRCRGPPAGGIVPLSQASKGSRSIRFSQGVILRCCPRMEFPRDVPRARAGEPGVLGGRPDGGLRLGDEGRASPCSRGPSFRRMNPLRRSPAAQINRLEVRVAERRFRLLVADGCGGGFR